MKAAEYRRTPKRKRITGPSVESLRIEPITSRLSATTYQAAYARQVLLCFPDPFHPHNPRLGFSPKSFSFFGFSV